MSYILDALKKIEHEKNKKIGPDGRVNISGDLFRERVRPAAKYPAGKMVLFGGVVLLLVCAGIWSALRKTGAHNSVVVQAMKPPPVAAPAPVTASTPAPLPVQPQPVPVPVAPVSPRAAVKAAPPAVVVTGEDEDAPPVREVSRSQKPVKSPPRSVASSQNLQTISPPADIKLSGIAWQEEHSGRRAVINGFLLKEGTVVSGAKITDIQSDRVRFVSPQGQFEIRLDAVLPAEVKR